jgi:hypothetical protein
MDLGVDPANSVHGNDDVALRCVPTQNVFLAEELNPFALVGSLEDVQRSHFITSGKTAAAGPRRCRRRGGYQTMCESLAILPGNAIACKEGRLLVRKVVRIGAYRM